MIGILGKIEHCALAARRVSFNHFGEKTNEARWLMIAPQQTRACLLFSTADSADFQVFAGIKHHEQGTGKMQ